MGDKYQPFVIANHLLTKSKKFGDWKKPTDIFFVNYSGNANHAEMYFNRDKMRYHICEPEEMKVTTADLAILTTGSMDSGSPYVEWVKKYIEEGLIKKLIIWGGFSRGSGPFEIFAKKLDFLRNNDIYYFARSHSDLEIFSQITESNRGFLAGDPMFWWNSKEGRKLGETLNMSYPIPTLDSNSKKLIAIPSIYSFKYNKNYWDELCSKADLVICIDTYSDKKVLERYPDKSVETNQPWVFFELIKDAKHVISGRLHGGLLAAHENIPTTLIVTDDATPGKGSFKFDAVGNHSSARFTPLCTVRTSKEAHELINSTELPELQTENIKIYENLTLESLDKLLYWAENIDKLKI